MFHLSLVLIKFQIFHECYLFSLKKFSYCCVVAKNRVYAEKKFTQCIRGLLSAIMTRWRSLTCESMKRLVSAYTLMCPLGNGTNVRRGDDENSTLQVVAIFFVFCGGGDTRTFIPPCISLRCILHSPIFNNDRTGGCLPIITNRRVLRRMFAFKGHSPCLITQSLWRWGTHARFGLQESCTEISSQRISSLLTMARATSVGSRYRTSGFRIKFLPSLGLPAESR